MRSFWQLNPKATALSNLRFYPKVTTHAFYTLTNDRESNTSTGVNINWVQALKNSKNPLLVSWRNPDAIVFYPQADC